MSAPEGEEWDGKFIKDHVEAAKNEAAEALNVASQALDLARKTADDLAALRAEIEETGLISGFSPDEIETCLQAQIAEAQISRIRAQRHD